MKCEVNIIIQTIKIIYQIQYNYIKHAMVLEIRHNNIENHALS
jgi:hypothetical protein